jgi:hypothetical protein
VVSEYVVSLAGSASLSGLTMFITKRSLERLAATSGALFFEAR